jgi:hypothetical protein
LCKEKDKAQMDFAGFSIFIIPEFMEMTCTMAFDPVVVKFKDRVPKQRGRGRLWLFTAIAVMFAAAAVPGVLVPFRTGLQTWAAV